MTMPTYKIAAALIAMLEGERQPAVPVDAVPEFAPFEIQWAVDANIRLAIEDGWLYLVDPAPITVLGVELAVVSVKSTITRWEADTPWGTLVAAAWCGDWGVALHQGDGATWGGLGSTLAEATRKAAAEIQLAP